LITDSSRTLGGITKTTIYYQGDLAMFTNQKTIIKATLARRLKFASTLLASALLVSGPVLAQSPGSLIVDPRAISFSEPDVSGPGRGYATAGGFTMNNGYLPDHCVYKRYSWRKLEPDRGQYDFTNTIERDVQRAAAQGKKFALGILALSASPYSDDDIDVPDYLVQEMPQGFYFTKSKGGRVYVPDWNDADFITRNNALIAALAAKYDGDKRIAWIDIRSYGNFGEWHLYDPIPYPYAPKGQNIPEDRSSNYKKEFYPMRSVSGSTPATLATKRAIVDSYVDSFRRTQLCMMTPDTVGLSYALSRSPYIGTRREGLGSQNFVNYIKQPPDGSPDVLTILKERWKTAPALCEFAGTWGLLNGKEVDLGKFTVDTIRQFHLCIASANFSHDHPTATRQNIENIGKTLGYRYRIARAVLEPVVTPASATTISYLWTNEGVSPIYSDWTIDVQLRDRITGTVLASQNSALQLRKLLPAGTALTQSDTRAALKAGPTWDTVKIWVPANILSSLKGRNRVDVCVKISDRSGFFPPLPLAMDGKLADGAYRLGTIAVAQ
jgi:hypothetical protein